MPDLQNKELLTAINTIGALVNRADNPFIKRDWQVIKHYLRQSTLGKEAK